MQRFLTLSILFLVAALLAAGLFFLKSADDAPALPAAGESAYRMLYERSRQSFWYMTVTLASGESYTVESSMGFDESGNLLGVYNSLGQPVTVKETPDFALDALSYQMMVLTAANLPVTASYSGLDRGACGLSAPTARIEIFYHDAEPVILTIGNPTFSGYSCYVCMEGDADVHLAPIDFYDVMTKPLNDHHRLVTGIKNPPSSAVQIAVIRPGQQNFIAANYGKEGRILPWQVDTPYVHAGSTERILDFVEKICEISAEAYVDTAYSLSDLEKYGLHEPSRLLVAFSDGTIRDIHLGDEAGDGLVYARLDSGGDVYLVNKARLPVFDKGGTDALLDRFITLVSSENIDSVAVRTTNEEWLLTISREPDQPNVYRINGKEVSSEQFGPAYTGIVGLQFDKTAEAMPMGDRLIDVRLLHTDGTVSRMSFYEYDLNYVQVETSGGGQFLMRTERLNNMLTALREGMQ